MRSPSTSITGIQGTVDALERGDPGDVDLAHGEAELGLQGRELLARTFAEVAAGAW